MFTLPTVILFLIIVYLLSYLYFSTKFNDWELPEWKTPKNKPAHWEERFGRLKGWWGYVTLGSAVIGIAATVIVHAKLAGFYAANGSPNAWFPDLVFGLMGFYLTFMAITDFFTQKAPFDVQDLTLALAVPVGVLGVVFNLFPKRYMLQFDPTNLQVDDLLQGAPFLVLVLILALMWFLGLPSIGFADIVVFGIATFAFSAMIGLQNMLYCLILACVLQLVAFIGANIWGWGTIVPTPFTTSRRVINAIWHFFTRSKKPLMGAESRQLAWLPMICLSYLAFGLIFV